MLKPINSIGIFLATRTVVESLLLVICRFIMILLNHFIIPTLGSISTQEEQLSSTGAAAMTLGLCIQGIHGIPCNLLGVRGGLVACNLVTFWGLQEVREGKKGLHVVTWDCR